MMAWCELGCAWAVTVSVLPHCVYWALPFPQHPETHNHGYLVRHFCIHMRPPPPVLLAENSGVRLEIGPTETLKLPTIFGGATPEPKQHFLALCISNTPS